MKMKLLSIAVAGAFASGLSSFMQRHGLAVGGMALVLDEAEHAKLGKEVQALYVKKDGKFRLDVEVEDVSGLKSALAAERTARETAERTAKETAKRFEGLDPDEIRKILEKMGSDEERQLLKDGKIDQVVEKRMAKAAQAAEKRLKEAQAETEAAKGRAAKFEQRVLDNHIRAAATKAGLHPNAIEDALFRARTIFKVNEDGDAFQLGTDGKPVLGKDGKSPYAPAEWLDGMKESAPHWFPAGNSGGGAPGDKNKPGGGAGQKTMKRTEFDALGPVAQQQTMKDKVTIVD
jgi:hypothetical protein